MSMRETKTTSFIVHLDPTAKEFRPTYLLPPPPSLYPFPAYLPPPRQLSTTPTRSLLLTPLPATTDFSTLRSQLNYFGDVKALRVEPGFATVDFYDLRHAESVLGAVRSQNGAFGVWAHYVVVSDGVNHGTLVLFNLQSDVTTRVLVPLFQPFGPIKEVRETPWKKNQKFIEFFDTRDAAKALKHMNGKEINGKPLIIEFSRPGGHGRKKLFQYSSPFQNPLNFNTPTLQLTQKSSSYSNSGSIEAWMGSVSLNNGGEVESENGNGVEEKRKKQQLFSSRRRNWKGKQGEKHETRYLIKEDGTVESRDIRTTVMIKNIPNKYSQKLVLDMLDKHCRHCNEQIGDGDEQQPLSSYDFFYLPIDFNNKCNVGYGFVNMTSPEAALRLYKAFHFQHWEVFNSRKICEVTYARVQGLEALKEHFKNSKFPSYDEMEQYLPVVFSPSRDGKDQLTEPLPIGIQRNEAAVTKSDGVAHRHETQQLSSEDTQEV